MIGGRYTCIISYIIVEAILIKYVVVVYLLLLLSIRIEAELKGKQLIIEKQQKEFKDKMYQLEKQAVLDKDRYV